jgi:uncharacterized protein YbaA (DUF1428 family)
MPRYVDGFLLPVPKKNVEAYRAMARKASKIWKDHGALAFRECMGDDLRVKGMRAFPKAVGAKKGETVMFSWIEYRSRAHRDRVNEKVMADPRIAAMGPDMPFDCKRMYYGGFQTIVSG